jgi:hypothetical protein
MLEEREREREREGKNTGACWILKPVVFVRQEIYIYDLSNKVLLSRQTRAKNDKTLCY